VTDPQRGQHENASRAGTERADARTSGHADERPSQRTGRRQDRKPDRHTDRRPGAVYQGAFEAVFALLIMAGVGYWLDGYFDTAPALLLIGTALGFASFSVRLIRLGRWMKDSGSAPPSDEEPSE
jgi:F0F1-type ATP synthase assembly protein I